MTRSPQLATVFKVNSKSATLAQASSIPAGCSPVVDANVRRQVVSVRTRVYRIDSMRGLEVRVRIPPTTGLGPTAQR